jgi:hypothetical protein
MVVKPTSADGEDESTNYAGPQRNFDRNSMSESDLRQHAIDVLTSRRCKVNEDTIRIVVDRIRARKEEGVRRRQGGVSCNFTEQDVERDAERA